MAIFLKPDVGWGQGSFCGEFPPHQAISTHPDSIYFDRFGNSYDLYPTYNSSPTSTIVVQTARFNLIFPLTGYSQAEREVCEAVFIYLDDILMQRESETSCGDPINNQEINIEFKKEVFDDPAVLGSASGLFYPGNFVPCPSGKYLNYSSIYSKLNGMNLYSQNNAIDGVISLSSTYANNNDFFTGFPNPTPIGLYDLFTVVLHEAMHLVTFSPQANFNNLYIGPYDILINTENGKMFECNGRCYHDHYDPLSTSTSTVSSGNFPLANNSNLSHLANNVYLMSPSLDRGMRKFLSNDEIAITCETGLQTTTCEGEFIDFVNSRSITGISCTELEGCCTNVFRYCENNVVIPIEEFNCRIVHNFDNIEVISVASLFPSNSGLVVFDGNNVIINNTTTLNSFDIVITYETTKSNGDCINFNTVVLIIFDQNCDCEFIPYDECANTLCHHDFESSTPESWVTFGFPFYFENTPDCNNNTADIKSSNGNNYVSFPHDNETIVLEVYNGPFDFCSLDLTFDLFSESGGTLEIWGSSEQPCDINDRGINRQCGNITVCGDGSIFESLCLGTININPSSGFMQHNLPILTSNFNQDINYIFLINANGGFFLDNIALNVDNCALNADFTVTIDPCNEVLVIPTETNNHQTHEWDFGDGTISTDQNPPVHTYTSNATYTIRHSIKDKCGNIEVSTQVVEIDCIVPPMTCTCEPPGAQNYTHLFAGSGTNISAFFPNANSVIGGKFIVCGNLIIDKNFTFNNCDIRMDPAALITKNENIDFRLISNTIIQGCTQMWKGINVLGRGRFLMDNSTLRSAEYAIRLNQLSTLSLTNSNFENNYVSIYGAPSNNYKTVTVEAMSGNIFSAPSDNFFWLPAYQDQVGYLLQRSFAGVYVHNTTINISGTVSSPNQFNGGSRMSNGIVASSSRITAKNNIFNVSTALFAIDDGGTFPVSQNELETLQGVGIFATNSPHVEVSKNAIKANRGVVVSKSNGAFIQINSNNISGNLTAKGIWIYNASNQSILIKNNDPITKFSTGIGLNMITAAQDIQIDNNKIQNNTSVATGIDLQTVDGSRLYSVRNNVVTSISLGSLIRMNLTKRFLVENNVTSNTLASFSVNGFSLTSNSRNQFRNNSFTGTTPNSQIGFITTGSDNDLYCCNTANAAGVGFNFQGMNSIVNRYKQNKMYNNGTGLVLPGGASIGTQTHMGNTWRNLVVGGVTRAINSSDPDASQFFVNFGQMDPAGGVLKPSIVTPSSWFADLSGNALNCGDNPDCGVRIYLIPDIKVPDTVIVDPGGGAISTDPDKLNDMIATTQGDVLNNDYFGQNLWKAQYDLLNELIDMPAYLSVEPILANFYNQNLNSDLRKVVDFDRNERQISKLTPSERILWLAMQDSLNWYTDTVNVIVSTDTSLTNTPLIDFYRNRISHLSADLSSLIGTVNTRAIGNVNALLTAVNAFQPTQAWVQKKKYLMVKRLEYMLNGKNSISPTNYTAITELANSCYLENGVVVHEAQSFLDLYHGYPTEWADSCATATSPRSTSTKFMDIKVFPNPTSNSITIATPVGVEGELEIYDNQGHSLKKVSIVLQNDRYTIDVSQWPNGIYVVKSVINSGPTIRHKFIKI